MAMNEPAHATVATITPSNADTTIDYIVSNNYGAATTIGVYSDVSSPFIRRFLVKFDLSSIPPGSTINTASIQLFITSHQGGFGWDVGRTYTANRVTTSWVEGTLNGVPPPPPGANWNTVDGTTNWGTAGGDFTSAGAASQTVHPYLPWPDSMIWDVTAIVKAWIEGGQPNYGFLIKDNAEDGAGTGTNFASREWTDPSLRPILTVDYTAAPPVTAPVGGEMLPVDAFRLVAPWLAVIAAVGCIGTAVVVAKKLRA